jgi:hypothetical protein
MSINKENIYKKNENRGPLFYLSVFISLLLLNFIIMFIVYSIGIEPIYRHITPFYALWKPIHNSCFFSLQLPLFILIGTILIYYANKISYKVLIASILYILYIILYFLFAKRISTQLIYELVVLLTTIVYSPLLNKYLL